MKSFVSWPKNNPESRGAKKVNLTKKIGLLFIFIFYFIFLDLNWTKKKANEYKK